MPQKDHYVSQTYLRGFTNRDGLLIPYYKNGYVTVGKPKSTVSVCRESDGDANSYFSDPRIIDEYLRLFENNWAKHVASLANMEGNIDTKYGIAGYVSFLRTCTPTAKRMAQICLTDSLQPYTEKIIKNGANDPELEPEIRQIFKEHQDNKCIETTVIPEYAHARAITTLVGIAHKLYCSDWLVLFNETATPFVTSDNPAVLYYRNKHNNIARTFIPLTPKIGVLISPNLSSEVPTIKEIGEFKHENDRNAEIKEEYVKVLNKLIVQSAENLVLHSEENEWLKTLVIENRTWRMDTEISEIPFEDGILTKAASDKHGNKIVTGVKL